MIKESRAQKVTIIAIAVVIFSVSAWYIAGTFQWPAIAGVLRDVDLLWLVVATGTIIVFWLARTIRWFILLRQLDVSIPFSELYMCSAVAIGFAIISPFQSGEMLKVEWLKKYRKIERFSGYSSFVVERTADLVVVFSIAAVSLLLLPDLGIDRKMAFWLLGALLFIIVAGMLLLWRFKFSGRIGEFQSHMRSCVRNTKVLMMVLVLTFFCWAITAAGWYACLVSLGSNVGYLNIVMLTSTITIINILSFIPGAVGVSEAGISLLLLHLGQSVPQAQTGALIIRFFGIMILVLGGMHLCVWQWRHRVGTNTSVNL